MLAGEDLEAFRARNNDTQLEFSYGYQPSQKTDAKDGSWQALGGADGSLPLRSEERSNAYRPRMRILGLAITFVRAAKTGSLIGKRIGSPDDVAVISQIYRDPRFETLRVYYRDAQGKIVHETAVTSRMAGTTAFLHGKGEQSVESFWADIKATMPKVGAVDFYILHNHPSGNPFPSGSQTGDGDIGVTRELSTLAGDAFKGHVVINSNKYAVIDPLGYFYVDRLSFRDTQDAILTPSKPHMALGESILNEKDLARIAKGIEQSPDAVTLIGADNKGYCRAVMSMDMRMLDNPRRLAGLLSRISHTTGSRFLSIAGISRELYDSHTDLIRQAIKQGFLHDVIDVYGRSANAFYGTKQSEEMNFGRKPAERGLAFYEDPAFYRMAATIQPTFDFAMQGSDRSGGGWLNLSPALAHGQAETAAMPISIADGMRGAEPAEVKLFRENMGLAHKIAQDFSNAGERDDLHQEALIALTKAARTYDPAKGKFSSYAGAVIRNHMIGVFRVRGNDRAVSLQAEQFGDGAATMEDVTPDDTAESPAVSAQRREAVGEVRAAVAALPPDLRSIMEQRLAGKHDDDVIAAAIGVFNLESASEYSEATVERALPEDDGAWRPVGGR
jgi:RNA polymerase sigma factor (sigma-70 family)